MPMIMIQYSAPAGGSNPNLYTGSAFEFARGDGIVSQGIMQAAGGCFCTLQAGGDIIAEEFQPPEANRYPIIPDEMYFSDAVVAGDRLVARIRNPTAGAIGIYATLQLSYTR